MIPSPILKVLSTFRKSRVRALLMGGQACIVHGSDEFSKDVDFALAIAPANLGRLRSALQALQARPVFFPPLSARALQRGHACHFRCEAGAARGIRIDVMGRMRGVDGFDRLWKRRTVLALKGAGRVDVLALPDLVRAKKTQRDKDWPMIRRLLEADYVRRDGTTDSSTISFWLKESRTPAMLLELAGRFPALARRTAARRPAVRAAIRGSRAAIELALEKEERAEREKDRRYWAPLRRELERWRLARQAGRVPPQA